MTDHSAQDVGLLRRAFGVFAYSRRALELVWTTSRALTLTLAVTAFLPRDSIPYQRSLIVLTWAASMVTISPRRARVSSRPPVWLGTISRV